MCHVRTLRALEPNLRMMLPQICVDIIALEHTELPKLPTLSTLSGLRRCRALYDCEADNVDELSFREGEVIIVTNEQTDDDNWMEGALERAPERRGMFPISFVHMLQD
ncbi:Arf-GAP with SH3 domain, ANK repeat and PH domain-containing protein 1 [Melipona quadrifasciata]|uniref:Arf-GAP with SH3 domain, ANK repeat and PH domain-containing protein 1 n=1 Tax=Melipona quadrifasciata TaxID=166423 RepID=A0A0N0BKN9_9HYME|nr:Arf-GAP with SH3 domain, ANK repeat and PH domain-containing protein 1 [Melipona quadrifasciata]